MLLRQFKNWVKGLQSGKHVWLLCLLGSLHQTIKHREVVRLYRDSDGDWHNQRRNFHLVAPELNVMSLPERYSSVLDLWCHGFIPAEGDLVLNLGAGIGDDALIFSKLVGPSGRVIAIEAHPVTYRTLLKTIELNKLTNVDALNLAISDSNSLIRISDFSSYLSNNLILPYGQLKNGVEVNAFKLVDILQRLNIESVDLLKINIEGSERQALSGFDSVDNKIRNLVVSCHDFKWAEGGDVRFRTYDFVMNTLQRLNYVVTTRQKDRRREVPYYIYASRR